MNSKDLEKKLWASAKKVSNKSNSLAAVHLVLGLVFLRYITDLSTNVEDPKNNQNNILNRTGEDDQDHIAYNEYFVPQQAQWNFLQSHVGETGIGQLIDDAIQSLEKLNDNLKGIFDLKYADPGLDQLVLVELVTVVGTIASNRNGNRKRSLIQAFDYLVRMFAINLNSSDEFYTPEEVARLLVEMVEPRQGKMYDGCCGSAGMFTQAGRFIKKYRGNINDASFYGQDNNPTIIKIARMNAIIHGIQADLRSADTFTNDLFPDLHADFIFASPPVNQTDWNGQLLANDNRWQFGTPPLKNANYAWLQQVVSKLAPHGNAGILLSKSSINDNGAEERNIRRNLIEARLIDCIVLLPSNIFYKSKSPVCLWLLAKNKYNSPSRKGGDEILFIDARKLSVRTSEGKRKLTDEMILLISRTYHRWKNINGDYTDLKNFCKAVSVDKVITNGYSLRPEKYLPRKRRRSMTAAILLIIFLGLLYFIDFQSGLFIQKHSVQDTTAKVSTGIEKTALRSAKRESTTVKKKENSKPVKAHETAKDSVAEKPVTKTAVERDVSDEVKNDTGLSGNSGVTRTAPAETTTVEKNIPGKANEPIDGVSYKVISKAYFYTEPDETTRRRAYITHWNNSYADIRALDEKNGFIYVVFTNHMHQRSKGWLRKMDLKEANE